MEFEQVLQWCTHDIGGEGRRLESWGIGREHDSLIRKWKENKKKGKERVAYL